MPSNAAGSKEIANPGKTGDSLICRLLPFSILYGLVSGQIRLMAFQSFSITPYLPQKLAKSLTVPFLLGW